MNELMFQAGVKGMSERSELIPCIYIYVWYTSVTRAPLYTLYAVRDIFQRPHEETSALSGTMCIIIAEAAKQIHSVCLSVRACLEKDQVVADSDRDLGHAPALPGMLSYRVI